MTNEEFNLWQSKLTVHDALKRIVEGENDGMVVMRLQFRADLLDECVQRGWASIDGIPDDDEMVWYYPTIAGRATYNLLALSETN